MASKYYNLEKVKPSGIELKERLVGIQRVTKVTKGGRTFSFSAIMVVGNEEGVVGHGMGKAQEVVSAITKEIGRVSPGSWHRLSMWFLLQ